MSCHSPEPRTCELINPVLFTNNRLLGIDSDMAVIQIIQTADAKKKKKALTLVFHECRTGKFPLKWVGNSWKYVSLSQGGSAWQMAGSAGSQSGSNTWVSHGSQSYKSITSLKEKDIFTEETSDVTRNKQHSAYLKSLTHILHSYLHWKGL